MGDRDGQDAPGADGGLRACLRQPIKELELAADALARAVDAHAKGDRRLAAELIASCNTAAVRAWVESLWGKDSPYVKLRVVDGALPAVSSALRVKARMPTSAVIRSLHERDGYHCRFCGVPVIRRQVRERMQKAYPHVLPWGRRNAEQHAAFQAMWAQYDHVLPYTRGGTNDLDNLVVACAPCNFGRMEHTLEEVGLIDPRTRPILRSTSWDGLERFR